VLDQGLSLDRDRRDVCRAVDAVFMCSSDGAAATPAGGGGPANSKPRGHGRKRKHDAGESAPAVAQPPRLLAPAADGARGAAAWKAHLDKFPAVLGRPWPCHSFFGPSRSCTRPRCPFVHELDARDVALDGQVREWCAKAAILKFSHPRS
jgi:hypothetical protein